MKVTRLTVKGYEHLDGVPCVCTGSGYAEGIMYFNDGEQRAIPIWTDTTRPAAAMTSANSQNCVASASSEYSSSYAAWRAFNNSNSDAYGWANKDSDTSPWLQLYVDVPQKNIEVTIKNRTRSSGVNGPVAGTILGSDDGAVWTELKTFSGFDGTTSGGICGTVNCENYNDAYQYVRIAFTAWAGGGKGLCVGEVNITGKMAT